MVPPKRKRLKPGERVALSLDVTQVDLIIEHTFIGENLLAMLYAAKVYDNIVVARCTPDELDLLARYVAIATNNAKEKKLQQKLGAIVEAIKTLRMNLNMFS